MTRLAIIGGTGIANRFNAREKEHKNIAAPWGEPSSALLIAEYAGKKIVFLPRHGDPHTIPPHRINYRANIWALKQIEVTDIIAVNTVGGITPGMSPQRIVIPDQLIDYSHGRASTFHEENLKQVTHIDFTQPYSESVRQRLISAAENLDAAIQGTYGTTQGPRLETAAEIARMERDGCDIVGMTSMPEAALAREQSINYACCALVVNRAAGKSDQPVTMEMIQYNLEQGMGRVVTLLEDFIDQY